MNAPLIRQEFILSVNCDDDRIDLGRTALLIAKEEYPDLVIGAYLRRLDELAGRARAQCSRSPSQADIVAAINDVLFHRDCFRGNTDDYYDPRNSFLNDVLDRRLGIPITLSVVYIEVARRLDLDVLGLGLPGHFVVGIHGSESILLDPYNEGMRLTEADCEARLRQIYGERVAFHPSMLRPLSKRQILTRMLINLKFIYGRQHDLGRTLAAIDRLLVLSPTAVQERRDRGVVCRELRFFGQAVADLSFYLDQVPSAADANAIRGLLDAATRERHWIN